MSLSLKPGVRIHGMVPEAILGLHICQSVFLENGKTCVVTCGTDGQHRSSSAHYTGRAFDLRTRHLLTTEREKIMREMKASLGADFDVIFEGDHFHVEYDPKTGVNL